MVARGYCNTVEYRQIPPDTIWELAFSNIIYKILYASILINCLLQENDYLVSHFDDDEDYGFADDDDKDEGPTY